MAVGLCTDKAENWTVLWEIAVHTNVLAQFKQTEKKVTFLRVLCFYI